MRRSGLLAAGVVAGVLMAGCSSSGSHSSSSSSSSSSASSASNGTPAPVVASGNFCTAWVTAAQNLAKLNPSPTDLSSARASLDTVAQQLSTLEASAPAPIKGALTDLVDAMHQASAALANPSNPDVSKLQQFGTKLATDSQQIATYVSANCK